MSEYGQVPQPNPQPNPTPQPHELRAPHGGEVDHDQLEIPVHIGVGELCGLYLDHMRHNRAYDPPGPRIKAQLQSVYNAIVSQEHEPDIAPLVALIRSLPGWTSTHTQICPHCGKGFQV